MFSFNCNFLSCTHSLWSDPQLLKLRFTQKYKTSAKIAFLITLASFWPRSQPFHSALYHPYFPRPSPCVSVGTPPSPLSPPPCLCSSFVRDHTEGRHVGGTCCWVGWLRGNEADRIRPQRAAGVMRVDSVKPRLLEICRESSSGLSAGTRRSP